MARPRMPIGAHGTIAVQKMGDGKWRARTLYRFDDGRRRQVERFAATRGKAQNRLLDALTTIKPPDSRAAVRRDTTIAALSEAFLAAKEGRVAETTLRNYRQSVRAVVKPGLGALSVSEVKPLLVQRFLDDTAKAASPSAALMARKTLAGMFRLALLNGAVTSDPMAGVETAGSRGPRGSKPLTPDRLAAFLAACRADPEMRRNDLPDLFEFLAFTGCRIAEACALRWKDVDLAERVIRVGANAREVKGKAPYVNELGKTDSSLRTLVIARRVAALLEARREYALSVDTEFVFPDPRGGLRRPTRVMNVLDARRATMGFPTLTSHAFRKTLATEMDKAGMSAREIAEYLGHKRPSMTQNVYMGRDVRSPGVANAVDSKFGVSSGSDLPEPPTSA